MSNNAYNAKVGTILLMANALAKHYSTWILKLAFVYLKNNQFPAHQALTKSFFPTEVLNVYCALWAARNVNSKKIT